MSRLRTSALWNGLPLKNYIYMSIFFVVVETIFVVFFKENLPPLVPLFYGQAVGGAQLTFRSGLLIVPILSLTVLIVNLVIVVFTENIFFQKILVASAFLFSLLMFITTFKIAFLVGFF